MSSFWVRVLQRRVYTAHRLSGFVGGYLLPRAFIYWLQDKGQMKIQAHGVNLHSCSEWLIQHYRPSSVGQSYSPISLGYRKYCESNTDRWTTADQIALHWVSERRRPILECPVIGCSWVLGPTRRNSHCEHYSPHVEPVIMFTFTWSVSR